MDLIFHAAENRRTLLNLQWVVVVAASYLLIFKKGEIVADQRTLLLVLLLLATVLVLYHVPRRVFDLKLLPPLLVVTDTLLISAAMALNTESPWDLFLLFFFGLFISAIGQNLVMIVAACLLISVISVAINPFSGMDLSRLDPDLLYRAPFLFAVSLLYAYLAEMARKETKRAEKAEETERLKRQLVSALAHDIKTPLGVILGYAETLAEKLGSESGENLEAVERIQDNAEHIVKLVTGFLEASRLESGKITFSSRPLQVNLLVREVGQQQMAKLREKEITLRVDLDARLPQIEANELQIDRVLWNLIGNAIKFTPRGGTITVRSWAEDGQVCVSVSDTGRGIPKEQLPLLFSEFRRLDGAEKIEGTGLGLFIVKTIVEAYGGAVEAESEEGRGSTFTVRLPIKS